MRQRHIQSDFMGSDGIQSRPLVSSKQPPLNHCFGSGSARIQSDFLKFDFKSSTSRPKFGRFSIPPSILTVKNLIRNHSCKVDPLTKNEKKHRCSPLCKCNARHLAVQYFDIRPIPPPPADNLLSCHALGPSWCNPAARIHGGTPNRPRHGGHG